MGAPDRIGSYIRQHGGHIGTDHARTFGDARHADQLTVELKLHRGAFGASIRGHDGAAS